VGFLRPPTSWLLGIADRFPAAVQPGVFVGLLLLLIWLVVRARRSLYNLIVRLLCLVVDFFVGLLLLPEFAWTRVQRSRGIVPGALTLASGRVAERILDVVADSYAAHPLVPISRRPPVILIILVLVAFGVDYWLMHKTPPNTATRFAFHVWHYWAQVKNWGLRK
jgi:hypothetical protein